MEYVRYFLISLGFSWIIYPSFIRFLNHYGTLQSVSEFALDAFKQKKKTPILGGVVFILVPVVVIFALKPTVIKDPKVMLILLTYIGYGLIGFVDDVKIIIEKNNKGLSAKTKFLAQVLLAVVFYFYYRQSISTWVSVPFTTIVLPLGLGYLGLIIIMFSGASNGVNLTDGMDGLAGGTSFIALSGFAYLAYVQNELSVLVLILLILGALLSYLVFNAHPAKIFMGDTGALALGAVLAAIALVLKQELTLVIMGAVFVFETACVFLQIGSVKLFKRRIFKYTPIHYAFTLSGWKERHVVLFFWFLGLVSMGLGILAGIS